MRRDERDRLQVAGVRALRRIAVAVEAPERARRDAEVAAASPPLQRIFANERGAVLLLRSIPGFAELWHREVPARYIRSTVDRDGAVWRVVSCVCGEHVALQRGNIAECPGACGRFFLHAGRSIRAKLFARDAELDAAA